MMDEKQSLLLTRHAGRVETFDEATGLGVVATTDGVRLPFQCISIADGTRTITVDIAVSFEVDFRVKRIEAVDIRPR